MPTKERNKKRKERSDRFRVESNPNESFREFEKRIKQLKKKGFL